MSFSNDEYSALHLWLLYNIILHLKTLSSVRSPNKLKCYAEKCLLSIDIEILSVFKSIFNTQRQSMRFTTNTNRDVAIFNPVYKITQRDLILFYSISFILYYIFCGGNQYFDTNKFYCFEHREPFKMMKTKTMLKRQIRVKHMKFLP